MELDSQHVREQRQARGWTQQQLAEIAGLSLRTVQRVETLGVGSHETVAALCAVLDMPRQRLLTSATPVPVATDPGRPLSSTFRLPLALIAGMALGSTLTLVALRFLGS